jgi:hypothetical protein
MRIRAELPSSRGSRSSAAWSPPSAGRARAARKRSRSRPAGSRGRPSSAGEAALRAAQDLGSSGPGHRPLPVFSRSGAHPSDGEREPHPCGWMFPAMDRLAIARAQVARRPSNDPRSHAGPRQHLVRVSAMHPRSSFSGSGKGIDPPVNSTLQDCDLIAILRRARCCGAHRCKRLLANHLRHRHSLHAARFGQSIGTISASMLSALTAYDWPGRELGNVIERWVMSRGRSGLGIAGPAAATATGSLAGRGSGDAGGRGRRPAGRPDGGDPAGRDFEVLKRRSGGPAGRRAPVRRGPADH